MNKNNNKTFSKISILIFVVLIIVFLSTCSFLLIKKYLNNEEIIKVDYSSQTKVDYKVYLLKNDYFETNYLGMNSTYITSLIDYIDINFENETQFNEKINGQYSYYIKATLQANKVNTTQQDSYWSKEIILKDPEFVKYDSDKFKVNTNLKIDYQKYNEMLAKFKKEYSLAINGNLKIELVLDSNGTSDKITSQIPVKTISEVNIPLTQQVIDISIETNDKETKGSAKDILYKTKDPIKFIVVAAVCIIFDITFVILFFKLLMLGFFRKTEYQKALSKILSTYDAIIVNVKELPNVDGLETIEVENFNELIDAHNEVRMPINFYEENNRKSTFILIGSTIAWKYELVNNARIKRRKE